MGTFGTCWGDLLAPCLFWVQAEVTRERLWLSGDSGIIKSSPSQSCFFPAFLYHAVISAHPHYAGGSHQLSCMTHLLSLPLFLFSIFPPFSPLPDEILLPGVSVIFICGLCPPQAMLFLCNIKGGGFAILKIWAGLSPAEIHLH